MPLFRIYTQTLIRMDTAIEKDESVVTQSWIVDELNELGATLLIQFAILAFWNNVHPTFGRVSQWLSPAVDSGANKCLVRYFRIDDLTGDPPAMSPIIDRPFTMLGPSGGAIGLPAQVAACVSFHGDLTGIPEFGGHQRLRQRRRGRIYIGPLNQYTVTPDVTTHVPYLEGSFQHCLSAAAANIATGVLPLQWSIWSRADATLYPVLGGFVDNSFDVMRKRKVIRSNRELWVA